MGMRNGEVKSHFVNISVTLSSVQRKMACVFDMLTVRTQLSYLLTLCAVFYVLDPAGERKQYDEDEDEGDEDEQKCVRLSHRALHFSRQGSKGHAHGVIEK